MSRPFLAHTREIGRCDPLDWFAASEGEGFYWERPAAGIAIAARGCVAELVASGPDRFETLDAQARELLGRVQGPGDPGRLPPPAGPRLVGGLAFDHTPGADGCWAGFPAARFVLPELLLVRRGDRAFATACTRADGGSDAASLAAALAERAAQGSGAAAPRSAPAPGPSPFRVRADRGAGEFLARVERALGAIGRGDLEKVVLARAARIESDRPFDAQSLLAALRASYPACASFAVARDDATFLGATPERLLTLDGRRIATAALAGTAARGRSPAEDCVLARALFESKKEQEEHAVVVRALREALEPRCRWLSIPESPRLMRLEGIQHLETPMQGELASSLGLLALAGALHPTPAVAGMPRAAALQWLRRHEAIDRGWYGGAVGHVGAADGELVVALRSALLRGRHAWCAAGAGIVAGSDPEAELREIRLKLHALLAPLLER